MLTHLWIRAHGGWYAHRQRALATRNKTWRRLQVRIHQHYNTSQCGYVGTSATFDGPPILPHQMHGIHIAVRAHVGKNVRILQHVTIGLHDDPDSPYYGAPTIGDDVRIGAGAIIVGKVHVGDGATIGAGAVVVRDVPAGFTVVSAPARYLPVKTAR